MYKTLPVSSLLALTVAIGSAQVHAVDPAAIEAGVFNLIPQLAVEQRYDTNILSQPDDELESWVTILAPSVHAQADLDKVKIQFGLVNTTGIYDRSNSDNYNDTRVNADVSWELNHRNQLDFSAVYNNTHEDRGTGFSQGTGAGSIEEPDEYTEMTYGAKYTYGSETSRGRLVLGVTDYDKLYTNHRDTTRGRDRHDLGGSATFYWGVGGRTDVLLEAKHTDINYDNDPVGGFGTLDSTVTKYLAGVTWAATAKTQGTVKLGQARKDFDSNQRKDFSGSSWEAEVQWAPKAHSVISLSTSREPRETTGMGNFIDAETYGVNWQHGWSSRITSNVFYNMSEESYEKSAVKREDDLESYGLRVDYSLLRWVDLGLSYTYSEKDSNLNQFDYDRNQVALHVNISM